MSRVFFVGRFFCKIIKYTLITDICSIIIINWFKLKTERLSNRIQIFYKSSLQVQFKDSIALRERKDMIIQMKGVSWIAGDTSILRRIDWTVHRKEHWGPL